MRPGVRTEYPHPFTMKPLQGKDVLSVMLRGLEFVDDYWLSAGTLLGLERDNGFIPHDTDIDIAVFGHWDRDRLPQDEFVPIRLVDDGPRHTQSAYLHVESDIIFDIFHYWPKEGDDTKIWNVQGQGYIDRTLSLVEPLAEKVYLDCVFSVPNEIDAYLTEWYGDWRTPIQGGKTEWLK